MPLVHMDREDLMLFSTCLQVIRRQITHETELSEAGKELATCVAHQCQMMSDKVVEVADNKVNADAGTRGRFARQRFE